MTFEENKKKLVDIADKVNTCRSCKLYMNTNHGVPGEGDPSTAIMFIGEAPGYYEDQLGRPFVGQAGKLLDQLLQSIKLERGSVFICNMVKHRPPENRDPLPEELKICGVYLDEQIRVIQPKVIVTLGRFSMAKFIPDESISRVHGMARFVDDAGRRFIVIPMYHPAAALRNGKIMVDLKNDFLKLPGLLDPKINQNKTADADDDNRKKTEDKQQLSFI